MLEPHAAGGTRFQASYPFQRQAAGDECREYADGVPRPSQHRSRQSRASARKTIKANRPAPRALALAPYRALLTSAQRAREEAPPTHTSGQPDAASAWRGPETGDTTRRPRIG